MSYRPITPIKGPGIAAVSELYDEQQDARHSQVEAEDRGRAADATRGRRGAWLFGGILAAALLAVVAVTMLWPRSAPGPTPQAVASLATLAGGTTTTTSFDGKQYTIIFTLANPQTIYAAARNFADKHGYAFDTPTDGRLAFDISGPQGGVAIGYFEKAGEPNSAVRIVIDASDLTADGSALK